jgi:hypothetical protein
VGNAILCEHFVLLYQMALEKAESASLVIELLALSLISVGVIGMIDTYPTV